MADAPAAPLTIKVAYDRALMRSAIWCYARFAWTGPRAGGAFLIVGAVLGVAAFLALEGRWNFATGAYVGLVAAALLIYPLAIALRWRRMNKLVAAMKRPESEFMLDEAAMTVRADSGTSVIPWSQFKDIWRCRTCWLLVMRTDNFITLSLKDASKPALDFLSAHVKT